MLKKIFCSIIFFVLFSKLLFADNLLFPIKSYLSDDYKAGTQNWSVAELSDGTICFGNSDGLLIKNGNDWCLYQTPSRRALRVIRNVENKIYVGGEDFGYFTKSFSGEYRYTSLSDSITTKWGEIWRIEVFENRVYLQGGKSILVFDIKSDSLISRSDSDEYYYFSIIENQILIQSDQGLFFVDKDLRKRTIKLSTNEGLDHSVIREAILLEDNLHLFTLGNGIYKYINNKIIPLDKPINKIVKNTQIYCAIKTLDKIVIGTVLDGIYILDNHLNIEKHLNNLSGLKNNTILSLGVDHNNNLWAGCDNGICFMDINAQCKDYVFDKTIGSGYASIRHNDYWYWGTNQGLFYSNTNDISHVHFMDNTQGQVWCIQEIGDKVICGHHKGMFEIKGNAIQQIDNTPGVMNIVRLRDSNYYFVWCYHKLMLYKYDYRNNCFVEKKEIISPFDISRVVKVDKQGYLWSNDRNHLIRFKIDFTNGNISQYEKYSIDGENLIFELDQNIYVWSNNSLLAYDFQNNSFSKINHVECSNVYSKDFIEVFCSLPSCYFNTMAANCKGLIEDLSKVRNRLKWNVQMASHYDNYFVINSNDGFINYTISNEKQISKIKVTLSEIKIKSKSESEYNWLSGNSVSYNYNNIRFKFSSNDSPNIEYRYKLIGYDENYSSFSSKNVKEYTNLPEGKYTFEVYGKEENGIEETFSEFEFVVSPPFYRSNTAKTVYFLILIVFIFTLFSLVKYLLKRKEKQLRHIQQEEILALEKTHKIETLKHEKNILEDSIAHKQRELTNTTHNVVMKNNLLLEIKAILETIKRNNEFKPSEINKIFQLIDININNENDWLVFESYFSEIHQNFFDKLKKDFPDISSTDLKLCAYIKLNKSTKEIATLMNISIRGVETSRYRLRKKLGLDRNENIYDLLSKY